MRFKLTVTDTNPLPFDLNITESGLFRSIFNWDDVGSERMLFANPLCLVAQNRPEPSELCQFEALREQATMCMSPVWSA